MEITMRMNSKLSLALMLVLAPVACLMAQAPANPPGAQGAGQTPGQAVAGQNGATTAAGQNGGQARQGFGGDPYAGKKKLLIVADVQTGFQHDSINHDMAVVEEMGRKTGTYISFLRTDTQLITKGKVTASSKRYATRPNNGRNLDYFDAVLFLGSGEGTMTDQQKADLLAFVHDDGKGLILGHAQGVDMYNWPEFGQMIGGFMDKEYPATGMYAKVVDPSWTAAAAFGKEPFLWTDQFPILLPQFKSGDVHTIIALDPSKMTPQQRQMGREDNYYPIVWAKMYGKGRVFNLTAGHNDATFDDPKTQALMLEGIKWALRMTEEQSSPDK
jgi:uncharacterized protein